METIVKKDLINNPTEEKMLKLGMKTKDKIYREKSRLTNVSASF